MFEDDPLWFKDAIIYELHVKAFSDSNNDGIGDFRGLIDRLDYLQSLGVNTLWLLPFYPSPLRDDGYDIADYRNIHPDYGSMADFRQFVREAHQRGLKVITELVINHTSDQHPWFQAARNAPPKSMKRNYYVWSDTNTKFPETRIIFTDSEKSNWAWDETAQAYYWHRFFSHQPDLNHNNPHVVKAVMRVMRFWFDAGVDGVRLDAVPYLCVREGTNNENLPETHQVIKYMRAELDKHYKNRMFLAEANQWPEDVRDYFGDGDECHMAYHFPLMPRMYMAIAQEDRHPIVEIMQQTPDIPDNCQWAIFLRNHDELTLEMVTDRERDYMYQMYVTDPRARVNVGIRRRLAPLMDNDYDRIRLMNSLLFSMPGSPIIYYGDEIGMGDNYFLGDRDGVRTPMQWSPDRNAGFSRADPQRLYLPPIMDSVYGHQAVNVEAQEKNPSSLLNWMRRLLTVRKSHQAFGRGTLRFLRPGNRKVIAYLRLYGDEAILCVANLSRGSQPVELDLSAYKGRVPVEMLARTPFPPITDLPYLLTLPGHGFYWFRLGTEETPPEWLQERVAQEELPLLVLFDGWHSFFRERVVPWRITMSDQLRRRFENETLPQFITAQRWRNSPVHHAGLVDHAEWSNGTDSRLLGLYRLDDALTDSLYFLPLALHWESRDETLQVLPTTTLAKVRQQASIGIIVDAFADGEFCRDVVRAIEEGTQLACGHGVIRFQAEAPLGAGLEDLSSIPVKAPKVLGGHSTVAIGQALFLKGYRQLQSGVRPAIELGRFLTNKHFPYAAHTLGTLEYHADDGTQTTLCLLQTYVQNQGDFWGYTLDYLAHFLEESRGADAPPVAADIAHHAYWVLLRTLAQRTAELHRALAEGTSPEFVAEAIVAEDRAAWRQLILAETAQTLELLSVRRSNLTGEARKDVDALLAHRQKIEGRIAQLATAAITGIKIRTHGDLHLRQVMINQNDFIFIDLEDGVDSFEVRRQKQTPLRDVAHLLQSLQSAGLTALAQANKERPDSVAPLDSLMGLWLDEAERVFITAYREHVADTPLVTSREDMQSALVLFRMEKALRDLRTELDLRPESASLMRRVLLQFAQSETGGEV
jgi:maltose alpha-D-glucosyltransferase/alpha-amylase